MTLPDGDSNPADSPNDERWKAHFARAGTLRVDTDNAPTAEQASTHRKQIEPWLSAICQSEHLALLIGNGLTTAITHEANVTGASMQGLDFKSTHAPKIVENARLSAVRTGRGTPNIEDQIRVANSLLEGLELLGQTNEADELRTDIDSVLFTLLSSILAAERGLDAHFQQHPESRAYQLLISFLLSFASRTASRERLHLFTTNYDRLLEYASDELGVRLIDRFVGALHPTFRSSRMDVDLHYNPPGIRGEPRFLEGVVRYTKLHGSIDWESKGDAIVRNHLPFGATDDYPQLRKTTKDWLLVYPNAAKDVETLAFPYAELFRDLAASICRPNSVLVTYGYSFGDDHINRIISDSLTIPSTHLVIISFDTADGRIPRFCEKTARDAQTTLLIGPHFGNINNLVDLYLPKPAIDHITNRRAELLRRRTASADTPPPNASDTPEAPE